MEKTKQKVDRELDKHNARLAKFSIKLAEKLAKYHGDISTTGLVMTACVTSILGYFGGGYVMPVKYITTVVGAMMVLAIVLGCL